MRTSAAPAVHMRSHGGARSVGRVLFCRSTGFGNTAWRFGGARVWVPGQGRAGPVYAPPLAVAIRCTAKSRNRWKRYSSAAHDMPCSPTDHSRPNLGGSQPLRPSPPWAFVRCSKVLTASQSRRAEARGQQSKTGRMGHAEVCAHKRTHTHTHSHTHT